MNSASDELAELRRMCSASRLDLFVFIRELEKLDMPSLRMEVDRKPAESTLGRVVGYQLGEGLQVLLAALRAGHANADGIESGAGGRGSLPRLEERMTGIP